MFLQPVRQGCLLQGKQAAMVDDMPRLGCPDLAAATVRWQQVWEDREEAGAGLGTVLPLLMPGAHAHYAAVHPDSNQARRHKGCTWSPHAWPDKSHAIHDVPQQGGGLKPRAEVWGMHVQRMAPGKQCSWTESFSRRRCAPA